MGGSAQEASSRHTGAGGELIAVAEDRIHVLTETGLRSVSLSTIHRATVALYGSSAEEIGLLGTFLSLSHGWWFPVTLPMWGARGRR